MRSFIAIICLCALTGCLSACSATQQQTFAADLSTACTVVSAAEAADPAFASHNGKIVNGVAYSCASAPAAEALVAAASAGQVVKVATPAAAAPAAPAAVP